MAEGGKEPAGSRGRRRERWKGRLLEGAPKKGRWQEEKSFTFSVNERNKCIPGGRAATVVVVLQGVSMVSPPAAAETERFSFCGSKLQSDPKFVQEEEDKKSGLE